MTNERSRRSPGESGRLPTLLVALVLLAAGVPAAGGEGATLELFHGPDDTGSMSLKKLRVVLDGRDLGVPVPDSKTDPEKALFAGKLTPGVHKLEVEASLEGGSSLFSYMDGYRIKMRSLVELEVLAGEGVAIRSRIVPKGGLTSPWAERNKLVLTLTAKEGSAPLDVASALPVPPPAEQAQPEPSPAATGGGAAEPATVQPPPAPTTVASAEPEGRKPASAAEPAQPEPSPAAPGRPARVAQPPERRASPPEEPVRVAAASATPERRPAAEAPRAKRESAVAEEPAAEPDRPATVAAAEPAPVSGATGKSASRKTQRPEPPDASPAPEPEVASPAPEPPQPSRDAAATRPTRVAAATPPRQRAAPEAPSAADTGDCALEPLAFEFDRATLTADAREALERFAACVAPTARRVRVEGHTDARGSDEYNRWLAWDRAAAVSAYLRDHGLAHRRVVTRFVGKARPLCAEQTESCFARNRRVETVLF